MIVLATLLQGGVCSVALAQHDSVWVRTMYGTGSGIDEVQALASDAQGNVYALIRGQAGSDTAMVTVKYSSSGERLWWRRFTHPGGVDPCGIAVDPWGDVLVAATSGSSTSNPDLMTMKYSAGGDSLWTVYFDAAGLGDVVSSIQADDYGNSYVSGTSVTPTGGKDCTLVRYSPYGDLRWSRVFDHSGGGSPDTILTSVIDTAGYLYQVGSTNGRYLAIKYSFVGNRIWARTGSVSGADYLIACALDVNHDLLCSGWSEFTWDSTGILTVKWDAAGDEQWSRCISGHAMQTNHAVSVAGDGQANVVVAGWWHDVANYSQDGLLVKYAPDGNELWRRLDPDPAYMHELYPQAMTISPDGGIYVVSLDWIPAGIMTVKYSSSGDSLWVRYASADDQAGSFSQAVVCVPGGVCIGGAVANRGDRQDVVTQFLADGTEQWTRSFNCSWTGTGYSSATDVAFDREGNVISVGYMDQTREYLEFAAAKYSPTGVLLWLRTEHGFPGRYDQAFKVKVDSPGNVYVTGWSEGETTGYDYLTVKYDAAGDRLWSRRYDGPAHAEDCPTDLAVDGQGNVIVTGRSHGGPTGFDYATVKYAPTGEELWTRRYSGAADSSDDEAEALAVDSAGAVYVTGEARELVSLYLVGTTIKYAPDGSRQWAYTYEPRDSFDWFNPRGIGLDADAGIRVCGSGHNSYILVKLRPSGETAWVRSSYVRLPSNTSGVVDPGGRTHISGVFHRDSCIAIAFDSGGHERWRRCLAGGGTGGIAVGSDSVVYVATRTPTDPYYNMLLNAYDSRGVLRWSDSCDGSVYATVVSPSNLLAVAGGTKGAFKTALFGPRLSVAEPVEHEGGQPSLAVVARVSLFTSSVVFQVRCASGRSVHLGIYDGTGRLVRDLGENAPGHGSLDCVWDGCDDSRQPVGGGVYFMRAASYGLGADGIRTYLSAVVKVTKLGKCGQPAGR